MDVLSNAPGPSFLCVPSVAELCYCSHIPASSRGRTDPARDRREGSNDNWIKQEKSPEVISDQGLSLPPRRPGHCKRHEGTILKDTKTLE